MMLGCRKDQIYSMTEDTCVICGAQLEELTGDLKCNGGCGQVRPVYKWMQAAFDRPYPYCAECFPLNWAPMEGGREYLLIERPEFWSKYAKDKYSNFQ
jgi:hypothetical protein